MDKLPPFLKDFIRAVEPKADKGPVTELRDRYEDRRREHSRSLTPQPIGYPKGSPEYLVEIRIRDWIRRMEAEKAELERRKKAHSAAPPQTPPPPPPPRS